MSLLLKGPIQTGLFFKNNLTFISGLTACTKAQGDRHGARGFYECENVFSQINHVYSRPGKYISQKYFTYRSVQIFQILFRGFNSQKSNKNLILRTRSCGTAFITQHIFIVLRLSLRLETQTDQILQRLTKHCS